MSRFIALPSLVFVWLLMAALPAGVSAQTPERTVKNAVVQLLTGDDGKDDVDVFTITVSNGDSKILERVFDAKEEIKPRTTFNIWLNKVTAAPADKVTGSKIVFRIDPKWDEHWVVNDARLTVNYDTGPPDKWHFGPFVLQRKGAGTFQVEFALTDDHRM